MVHYKTVLGEINEFLFHFLEVLLKKIKNQQAYSDRTWQAGLVEVENRKLENISQGGLGLGLGLWRGAGLSNRLRSVIPD